MSATSMDITTFSPEGKKGNDVEHVNLRENITIEEQNLIAPVVKCRNGLAASFYPALKGRGPGRPKGSGNIKKGDVRYDAAARRKRMREQRKLLATNATKEQESQTPLQEANTANGKRRDSSGASSAKNASASVAQRTPRPAFAEVADIFPDPSTSKVGEGSNFDEFESSLAMRLRGWLDDHDVQVVSQSNNGADPSLFPTILPPSIISLVTPPLSEGLDTPPLVWPLPVTPDLLPALPSPVEFAKAPPPPAELQGMVFKTGAQDITFSPSLDWEKDVWALGAQHDDFGLWFQAS